MTASAVRERPGTHAHSAPSTLAGLPGPRSHTRNVELCGLLKGFHALVPMRPRSTEGTTQAPLPFWASGLRDAYSVTHSASLSEEPLPPAASLL